MNIKYYFKATFAWVVGGLNNKYRSEKRNRKDLKASKSPWQQWLDDFPWESEAQKKAILSLDLWLKRLPVPAQNFTIMGILAYVFQKDHEAGEWWAETVGNQVTSLENQIKLLQEQVFKLRYEIDQTKAQLHVKIE